MSGVIDALAAHPSCDVLRKAELDDWLARNPRASCVSSRRVTGGGCGSA